MKRRILSWLMATVMVCTLLSGTAFAGRGDAEQGHNHNESGYCSICKSGTKTDITSLADTYPAAEDFDYTEGEDADYSEEQPPLTALVYINGVGYQSLNEAVQAANPGDTLQLAGDIVLAGTIYINKELTIDGSYFSIVRDESFTSDALLNLESGAKVTLKNVTLNGSNKFGAGLVNVLSTAQLIISENTVLKDSWADYGAAVYVMENAILNIEGGDIAANWAENSGGAIYNEGTIYLTSGKIYGNQASWGGGIYSKGSIYFGGDAEVIDNLDFNNGDDNIHLESADLLVLAADYTGNLGVNLHEETGAVDGEKVATVQSGSIQENSIVSDWDTEYVGEINEYSEIVLSSGAEPVQFVLSFDSGFEDVAAPDSQYVSEGTLAQDPGALYKDGYNFDGWYLEIAEQPFDFAAIPITSDTLLTAHWTEAAPATATVSYYVQGELYTEDTVELNQLATRPEDPPVVDGYSFDGWFLQDEEQPFDFDTTPITQDISLSASFSELPVYPVYFDMAGHGVQIDTSNVVEGKYVARPDDPSEEGYEFAGWYADPEYINNFDFDNTAIYTETTVYAKWTEATPATATVSYYVQGELYKEDTVELNQPTTAPEDPPVVDGYRFAGWFLHGAEEAFDFNTAIVEDISLTASFEQIPTEPESTEPESTEPESTEPESTEPESTEPESTEPESTEPESTEPTTTEPAYYSITFYTAYGVTPEGQLVESGRTVKKPDDLSTSGFVFEGWYTDIGYTTAYDFNAPVTASFTLYAKWSPEQTEPQYFQVSYFSERGTIPAVETVEKGYRATKPTDPAADGYVFTGWFTEKELKNLYDFNTEVTHSMTLYAGWVELPSQNFVISFDSNGHGNTPNPQTVTSGKKAVKPSDPTAVGYTFSGWYTDRSCTQAFDFAAAIYGNQTLYAGWTAIRYTVHFDSNGGTGTMSSQSYVYDQKALLPANAFAKTGFNFIGWNTEADGSGAYVADQGEIRNLTAVAGSTVNLYAQWKNIYSIIEGAGAKVQKGTKEGLTFRADGDYSKFTGIRIDNNNVATSQYTSWSGSTYVKLNADYVNMMPAGKHTLKIMYTDGSVETTFEVVSGTPTTGDTNNLLIWIILAIAALIVIIVIVLILIGRRRREQAYEDDYREYNEYNDDYYDDDDDDEYYDR